MAKEHTGAWSASGQAELENRIVLLRVELEYMRGGAAKGILCTLCILFICSSPPPPSPPPQIVAKFYVRQEDRQAGRRQSGDRRTDRQATDRQATSVLATGGQSVGYRFHTRVSLSTVGDIKIAPPAEIFT